MDAALLRDLQDRGRFFYERFPGAAAAEEWKRARERAERKQAAHTREDGGSPGEREEAARTRSSSLDTQSLLLSTILRNPLLRQAAFPRRSVATPARTPRLARRR
jgi:hypothetical protein